MLNAKTIVTNTESVTTMLSVNVSLDMKEIPAQRSLALLGIVMQISLRQLTQHMRWSHVVDKGIVTQKQDFASVTHFIGVITARRQNVYLIAVVMGSASPWERRRRRMMGGLWITLPLIPYGMRMPHLGADAILAGPDMIVQKRYVTQDSTPETMAVLQRLSHWSVMRLPLSVGDSSWGFLVGWENPT